MISVPAVWVRLEMMMTWKSACCTVCEGLLHFAWTGIPDKIRKHFIEIIEYIGWVCEDCRCVAKSQANKIKSEVANLAESVATLQVEMLEFQALRQSETLVTPTASVPLRESPRSKPKPSPPARSAAASNHVSLTDIDIQRMLNDANRRKKNVTVSGLVECGSATCVEDTDLGANAATDPDKAAFQQLCVNYLQCKPFVVSCQRIGKQTSDKPRRLLVRLRDEIQHQKYCECSSVTIVWRHRCYRSCVHKSGPHRCCWKVSLREKTKATTTEVG